jgi:hypothetical protein
MVEKRLRIHNHFGKMIEPIQQTAADFELPDVTK